MEANDLTDFLSVFQWVGHSTLPRQLLSCFDSLLHRKLLDLLARLESSDPLLHSFVTSHLRLLSVEGRAWLLRAPHLAGHLVYPSSSCPAVAGVFLARSLLAEAVRLRLIPLVGTPLWTARGDFSAGHASEVSPVGAAETEGAEGSALAVPVDWCSDLSYPPMDRGGNTLATLSGRDASAAITKVRLALGLIGAVSPAAHSFVAEVLQSISLRKELEAPERFTSGSFRGLIGLALLMNAHLVSVTVYDVADSILHEAIHAALYVYEAVAGTLSTGQVTDEGFVASPWTGATLNIDSYVQACFVWFGLSWFWQRAAAFALDHPRVDGLRVRAERGFHSRPVTSLLTPYHEFLKPMTLDALLRAEAVMEDALFRSSEEGVRRSSAGYYLASLPSFCRHLPPHPPATEL